MNCVKIFFHEANLLTGALRYGLRPAQRPLAIKQNLLLVVGMTFFQGFHEEFCLSTDFGRRVSQSVYRGAVSAFSIPYGLFYISLLLFHGFIITVIWPHL